jgi:hypothetical protein
LGSINSQLKALGVSPITSMTDLEGVLLEKNKENKMSTTTGT